MRELRQDSAYRSIHLNLLQRPMMGVASVTSYILWLLLQELLMTFHWLGPMALAMNQPVALNGPLSEEQLEQSEGKILGSQLELIDILGEVE